MTDNIAITKLRDAQCLRKSLPCTCILYLFHLKDCNGALLVAVVDVATQRQTAEFDTVKVNGVKCMQNV